MRIGAILSVIAVCISGCNSNHKLFTKVSPSQSGINFENTIVESMEMNIIDDENIYNGGGVGVGDFNNDGLMDLYFSGNMVENKLYLNKGDFKFEDITETSGTNAANRWSRGVAIIDINKDGWQDIYVSCTMLDQADRRENLLFINQGLVNGIPHFEEKGQVYGLNSSKHTTQASFLDYDLDGDLDVFLANNVFAKRDNPNNFRKRFVQGEHPSTDQLFRSDFDSIQGHPVFTDVSKAAGIQQEGYSHSVITCDINKDGWTDIFVANDYLSEDIFYINNQDGTFTNRSRELLKHTSFNSMGADIIDLNNDDLDDIIELDMNPEDNFRKKTMLGGARYEAYQLNLIYDYQFQYIRNMLHLNRGGKELNGGIPMFSDIGFMSGIAETDWSWTPLVGDFDLDGHKDLIITNGFPKDVTDHDFMAYRNSAFGMNDKAKLLSLIPEVKIPNYAYQNKGGAIFKDVTEEWGLLEPSFSNGAAVADLDNDGDLDVVINNINSPVTVYKNNARASFPLNNYLTVTLQDTGTSSTVLGARVRLKMGEQQISNYAQNVRGYLSSNDERLHFGLGKVDFVDSLFVEWIGGGGDTLTKVETNSVLQIVKTTENLNPITDQEDSYNTLLVDISDQFPLNYAYKVKDINDYSVQRTIPHKYSQLGPKISIADFNEDGLEDFVVNQQDSVIPVLFLQTQTGFEKKDILIVGELKANSNASTIALVDIDNDGKQDIIIGFSEFENTLNTEFSSLLLLKNQGDATFQPSFIPLDKGLNVSVIKVADIDNDGLEDLFIGCHSNIGRYPEGNPSFLLKNLSHSGKVTFKDVTNTVSPDLMNIGIINDAELVDIDGDNDPDLILAGDYIPITLLENTAGTFKDKKALTPNGWWKCVELEDVDQDGDLDILAGNYGLNSSFTVEQAGILINYYQDYDDNGVIESLLSRKYRDRQGKMKRFLVSSRDEVIALFPEVKKRHLEYSNFAGSKFDQLFEEETFSNFKQKIAEEFKSGVLLNHKEAGFEFRPFPSFAQLSPIFDFGSIDIDLDGKNDLLIAGNYYGAEVFNGRLDAFNGLTMLNLGKGDFELLPIDKSGFLAKRDPKEIAFLQSFRERFILISQHNWPIKIFKLRTKE